MEQKSKHRSWYWTYNNYTDEIIEKIRGLNYKYLVFGYEKAPTTGTPHLQGYTTFKSPITFDRFCSLVPGISIRVANGSAFKNREYCTKDGVFEEYGDIPKQGKRTDIDTIRTMVKEGASMINICEVATSYQSIRIAETFKKYMERKRNFKTYVYWFYGDTGCGKSRCAAEMFPNAYWCMETNKWWEGYDAHKIVIIDDMRANFCTFNWLLKLLDRYPLRIECKGGSREFLAETIIITTCKPPEDMYPNMSEDIGQLLRRIDNILYFGTEHGTEVGGNTKPLLFDEPN